LAFRFYRDIDLRLRLNPNTGDILAREDNDAVKNAVKNIILTQKGEAMFNTAFGTNLRKLLFSPISHFVVLRITKQIEFAIENFEPRVYNVEVKVNFNASQHLLIASVSFIIIGSNNAVSMNIPLETLR
jgi:phage baseplate assembly protein W